MPRNSSHDDTQVLGQRPQSFYGPDDWDGMTDPLVQHAEYEAAQHRWDEQYANLSLWQKVRFHLGLTVRVPREWHIEQTPGEPHVARVIPFPRTTISE
jgi:hypothetical protein